MRRLTYSRDKPRHRAIDSKLDADDVAALMIVAIKALSLPRVAGVQPEVADQVFWAVRAAAQSAGPGFVTVGRREEPSPWKEPSPRGGEGMGKCLSQGDWGTGGRHLPGSRRPAAASASRPARSLAIAVVRGGQSGPPATMCRPLATRGSDP
jgi:hypothetical protein